MPLNGIGSTRDYYKLGSSHLVSNPSYKDKEKIKCVIQKLFAIV